jgi:tetratricopeptide (TPR) repeat protein
LFLRNAYTEGIQWSERALGVTMEAPAELRAPVMAWVAFFADQIGQKDKASHYAQEGLDLARQSQDKELLALALFVRGVVSIEAGDPQLAYACLEEALPLARATQSPFVLPGVLLYLGLMCAGAGEFTQAELYGQEGDETAQRLFAPFWHAMGLWFSGHLAFLRNDIGKARNDLQLALQKAGENQLNMFVAHITEMVGRVQIIDLDLAGARSSLTRSFTMLQEQVLKPCLAHGLEGFARLALAQGDPQRAARLMGASQAHLKTLGMNMIPIEQALYNQTLAAVQKQMGDMAYQQEYTAGENLKVDEAIELAMKDE